MMLSQVHDSGQPKMSAMPLPGTGSVSSNAANASALLFSASMVYTPNSSANDLVTRKPCRPPAIISSPSTVRWSPTSEPSGSSPASHAKCPGYQLLAQKSI